MWLVQLSRASEVRSVKQSEGGLSIKQSKVSVFAQLQSEYGQSSEVAQLSRESEGGLPVKQSECGCSVKQSE